MLTGLSPRTRGNLLVMGFKMRAPGSIPAHAGQPEARHGRQRPARVYPRARGATASSGASILRQQGLSPRTRGNRPDMRLHLNEVGSIPAHAGQPFSRTGHSFRLKVYPRARGATMHSDMDVIRATGLSPRTRGNPHHFSPFPSVSGSIPAHAGQPPCKEEEMSSLGVYPRARGATCHASAHMVHARGLSPRTRGNQACVDGIFRDVGSIPAHAGQPSPTSQSDRSSKVYPRARGATVVLMLLTTVPLGLSPRTRGNRLSQRIVRGGRGSIPAHAGQPIVHDFSSG